MFFGLTQRLIVLDAETCSAVDLKKAGGDRYWADPSTRTLMVGFKPHQAQDCWVWEPHAAPTPAYFTEAVAAPPEQSMFCAFNAAFDRRAMARLGLTTPAEKWLDIMLLAYILAFSGRLDDVLKQLEVCDRYGNLVKKNPEGTRLITLFSKKQAPWFQYPTEWGRFKSYCGDDVEVEDLLLAKCRTWLDTPTFAPQVRALQRQWLINQRINERGMPISEATVRGALNIKYDATHRLSERIKTLSGVSNPNSIPQLSNWLHSQGVQVPSLKAEVLRELLASPHLLPDHVRQVLQARLEIGKTSVKKYDAMSRMAVDGRLRNGYTLYGASRTGRDASRGLNLANLERPKLKPAHGEYVADLIETGDIDLLESRSFSTLSAIELLGSSVRGAIKAPEGAGITAVDLKSIESVGLAWIAGCDTILDLFHQGKDTYKDFATRHYGIAYEDVTSEQRTFCKPPVLGCGYGAAGTALVRYAAGMNIEFSEEDADAAVVTFRTSFPEIPLFWSNVQNAFIRAVQFPGSTQHVFACKSWSPHGRKYDEYRTYPYVSFYFDGTFLMLRLPSGRVLFYYQPVISSETRISKKGNEYSATELSYMGKGHQEQGAWTRVKTHGGKITENIVQAFCRDILYHGIELIEERGIELVGSTYDETICLTSKENGEQEFEAIKKCMTTKPPWLDDRFYLACDGYFNAGRYRK